MKAILEGVDSVRRIVRVSDFHYFIAVINGLIIMTTLFIKSLLTSLCQREYLYAYWAKGKGRP